MNTTTAATQANVTVATIRTWCRNGVITATKTAGRWIIDSASLAARIAISAWKRPARKETPMIDLTATYTSALIPGEAPKDITVQVKKRTTPDGEHLITIRGIAALFASTFDAIADEGDRIAALTILHGKTIVISDTPNTDWDGDPLARENGRLRTSYRGGVPGLSVDDVLDVAARIRAQLAA